MASSSNQAAFCSEYPPRVNYCPYAAPRSVLALFAFALVGTGGIWTPSSVQQRGECGYPFAHIQLAPVNLKGGIRQPTENLELIRAVFKPSISDVANMLAVSRQTVYNWMAGDRPCVESANRLEDVAKAADLVATHGLATSAYLLKRKIRDGKTLFDIVREGGSAQEAARSLIRIAENEASQRALLQNKLAGRQVARPDISEFGIPMLDERI